MDIKVYLQLNIIKVVRVAKYTQTYPLIFILLGLIFGVIGYFEHIFLIATLIIVLALRKHALIFLISFLCALLYSQAIASTINNDLDNLNNTVIDIEASISEITNTNDFSQIATLKVEEYYTLLTARLDRYPTLTKHTLLHLHGKLKLVDEVFEQGYANYLKSKRIFFSVEDATFQPVKGTKYEDIFYTFRQKAKEAINRNINEPEASLINGILLGEKVSTSEELKNSLVSSGTSHIVSISGYNFSLIYGALSELKRFINIRFAQLISIFLILGFMFVIGIDNIPAQRATIMICFLACSKLIGRRANLWVLLLLSITLILIEFPLFYSNISFQLTVFATIGLILITKRFTQIFKHAKLPAWISENIGTSFAALIATLPISYMSFQSVSLTGLISNLFILPIIPVLTWLSIISVILGLVGLGMVGGVIFHSSYELAKLINSLILFFGRYPVLIESPAGFIATLFGILLLLLILDYYLQNEASKSIGTNIHGRELSVL